MFNEKIPNFETATVCPSFWMVDSSHMSRKSHRLIPGNTPQTAWSNLTPSGNWLLWKIPDETRWSEPSEGHLHRWFPIAMFERLWGSIPACSSLSWFLWLWWLGCSSNMKNRWRNRYLQLMSDIFQSTHATNLKSERVKTMEVSWNGGTPSHHPFLDGIFHAIDHPLLAWGSPMTMQTPLSSHASKPFGIPWPSWSTTASH